MCNISKSVSNFSLERILTLQTACFVLKYSYRKVVILIMENFSESASESVFFLCKELFPENYLVISARLWPMPSVHRCGYRFTSELIGDRNERAMVIVSTDYSGAESFFNTLGRENTLPSAIKKRASTFFAKNA